MKTEQEQIEEMAYSVCGAHDVGIIKSCANCKYKNSCEKIIYARMFLRKGYSKASDVIDEFLERLKKRLEEFAKRDYEDSVPYYHADCEQIDDVIEELADEMRQEVEN